MCRCNLIAALEASNSALKSGNFYKIILKTFPNKGLGIRVFPFAIVAFIVVLHSVANPSHLASK